jgi:hypothetical protein
MATTIRGSDNFDTAFAKSVAIIADVKAYDINGGTNSQLAWQTRDLNTELDDPENIVTIASNQFTLQAGTYLIEWSAPAYQVYRHFTRLENVTDAVTVAEGTTEYTYQTAQVQTRSFGATIVSLAGAKAFEVQHFCDTTNTTNGLGVSSVIAGASQNSVYTLVKIHKIGA